MLADERAAPIAGANVTAPTAYAARVDRAIAALAASRLRSFVAILLLALACTLPGIAAVPPVDRDEPSTAIASRAMLEAGDLLTIPPQAGVSAIRGPAIHWLQAGAVRLLGGDFDAPIWVYRLPSALGGVAAALLTWWAVLAFGRPRAALFSGLAMAGCLLVAAEARMGRPDAIALPALVLAQGALARLWLADDDSKRNWRDIGLFWTALAGALTAGGLTGAVIVGSTAAVLSVAAKSFGWLRRLAPVAGIAWLLLLVVPWLLVTRAAGPGGSLLARFLGLDAIALFMNPPPRLTPPPGSYLFLFFATFWPSAAFVALGARRFIEELRQPVVLFALAWSIPYWLLCEATPLKTPDAILPVYPALALLAGYAVDGKAIDLHGRLRQVIAAGPFGVPLIALVVMPLLMLLIDGSVSWLGAALCLAATAIGYAGWRQLRAGEAATAFVTSLAAAVALYVGVFGFLIPGSPGLDLSRRAVAAARAVADCAEPEIAGAGFIEPSLRFAGGNRTWLGAGDGAADFLAAGGCRVAIVEQGANEAFLSRANDIGLAVTERGRLKGYNFARGRFANLILYAAGGPE